jgi:hypothetical protein
MVGQQQQKNRRFINDISMLWLGLDKKVTKRWKDSPFCHKGV